MALVALCTVFGAVIGSFLNVIVWRVPRKESIVAPGSHCPKCERPVRAYDNVPVLSWLVLRGRCRDCRAPISVQYPAVEAATGALFGLLAWRLGANATLVALLYLAAIGVALALIDIKHRRLPTVLVNPSYVVGAVLLTVAALVDGRPWALLRALIGLVALCAFYFLLWYVKPGGMGLGDVRLAGLLGMYLGFLGWRQLVLGAFAAFLLGGGFSLVLLALGRAGRKTKVPFGPFMVAGAFVAVLAAGPLVTGYLDLVGIS